MDYEKRYKDALEKARQLCVYPTTKPFINDLQDLFPELKENKESENERIRGAIIDHLKDNNLTEWAAWLEKQNEQKSADKVEPFDRYEGLTDFERTLADICIGWIGKEIGWKEYIKDSADVLLRIAVEKFNSVQDVPFEQKPAWSEEDEEMLRDAIGAVGAADYYTYDDKRKIERWLKSLKQRIGG